MSCENENKIVYGKRNRSREEPLDIKLDRTDARSEERLARFLPVLMTQYQRGNYCRRALYNGRVVRNRKNVAREASRDARRKSREYVRPVNAYQNVPRRQRKRKVTSRALRHYRVDRDRCVPNCDRLKFEYTHLPNNRNGTSVMRSNDLGRLYSSSKNRIGFVRSFRVLSGGDNYDNARVFKRKFLLPYRRFETALCSLRSVSGDGWGGDTIVFVHIALFDNTREFQKISSSTKE